MSKTKLKGLNSSTYASNRMRGLLECANLNGNAGPKSSETLVELEPWAS